MADIVVNIRGNADGLENALNSAGNTPLPPRPGTVLPSSPVATPTTIPASGGSDISYPSSGGANVATPSNNSPIIPTYDRMAQDIRREMLSRGVVMVPGSSNYNQLMNTITTTTRNRANEALDVKYDEKFFNLNQQREQERKTAIDEIEQKRQTALSRTTDPLQIASINRNFDDALNKRLSRIDTKFEPKYDELTNEANAERARIDKDLTRIIQELTEELKRSNPNSYLNRLREERRQASFRRDNAESEDEVRQASREIQEIDRRMARATGRGGNMLQRIGAGWGTAVSIGKIGMDAWNAYLTNTGMEIGEVSAAANGNAFAAIAQDLNRRRMAASSWGAGIGGVLGGISGGLAAALGSLGIGTGAGIAGGMTLGAGAGSWLGSAVFTALHGGEENQVKLGQLWADQEKRLQNYTQLAMMVRGDRSVSQTRQDLLGYSSLNAAMLGTFDDYRGENLNGLGGVNLDNGLSLYDLGYTQDQAAKVIAQRLSQRGFYTTPQNAYRNALTSDALERVYNMTSGSLGQLSAYDRYGNNANQDIANLIASLGARGTLGMSGGQVLRANEFMSYQTQLMEMQKGWMNPNSRFAQRQLLAAQDAFGNNLDSRAITEIGQINNAITTPQDGYAKVMTYDVVQKLFPETRGNLLAIQQKLYSNNPEDRAKIQKAMFNKISDVYGGMNTTSGYLAFSQYTGIRDPDRLQKWVNRMQRGLPQVTEGNVSTDTAALKDYTPKVSKDMAMYQDETVKQISEQLDGLSGTTQAMLNTFQRQLNEIIAGLK